MAEALFSVKQLPGAEVRSAGIFAENAPLSRHARTILEGEGIDFPHTSKQLTLEDLQWSTHVLTMTASHKQYLVRNYPEMAHKIHTLKEFAEGVPSDVSDPYGGSESDH